MTSAGHPEAEAHSTRKRRPAVSRGTGRAAAHPASSLRATHRPRCRTPERHTFTCAPALWTWRPGGRSVGRSADREPGGDVAHSPRHAAQRQPQTCGLRSRPRAGSAARRADEATAGLPPAAPDARTTLPRVQPAETDQALPSLSPPEPRPPARAEIGASRPDGSSHGPISTRTTDLAKPRRTGRRRGPRHDCTQRDGRYQSQPPLPSVLH